MSAGLRNLFGLRCLVGLCPCFTISTTTHIGHQCIICGKQKLYERKDVFAKYWADQQQAKLEAMQRGRE